MRRHTTASCFATYMLPHVLFVADFEERERIVRVCCLAWNIGLFPDAAERARHIENTLALFFDGEEAPPPPGVRQGYGEGLHMLADRKRDLFPWRFTERTRALSDATPKLLAEAAERERVEDALRQSHKMEAVGRLTGGIARDFNNMLQAIGGSLEMITRRVAQGRATDAALLVEGARKMVTRAAALTNRLLAFARRQALQPVSLEPDALVRGMIELIGRMVGPEITVEIRMRDGAWTVLCDPNQLESALLNLAINARDAMPDGGTLTISAQDVSLSAADVAGQDGIQPGDYVEIAVADTGMDEATRARAFEPFFTTKPMGQGTGLGLSQLYGFVRQSGGTVRLDSALGRGTTVRPYLRRHAPVRDGEAPASGHAAVEAAPVGSTVLLVEDEALIRTPFKVAAPFPILVDEQGIA